MADKNSNVMPLAPVQASENVMGRLAGILLRFAGNNGSGKNSLCRRDMATMADTSWEAIDSALKALRDEGAIGIERHRLVINKDMLREIAVAGHFQS